MPRKYRAEVAAEAAEHDRRARELALHRWVADGKVGVRPYYVVEGDVCSEYRVVGDVKWYRDNVKHGPWPSAWLIANLGLGLAALNPPSKPVTPQWQHSYGLAVGGSGGTIGGAGGGGGGGASWIGAGSAGATGCGGLSANVGAAQETKNALTKDMVQKYYDGTRDKV